MLTTFLLAGISLLLGIQAVSAATLDKSSSTADDSSATAARRQQLEKIVVAKLAFYSAHYPDMNFVVLDSAGDIKRNMHALAKIIGQDPIPLDYEHPKGLRQGLLMATLMRIEILLQTDVGSATLFKPGSGAIARRKRVCVITINPWAIAADDRAATSHLLDLPPQAFNAVPPENYLDHVSHLKFALDHEIYHCLDATYNGAMPMSQLKHWGGYNDYKDESGADAFGILMNIAEHGSITAYARMLRNIRGLTLLSGDTDHYTYRRIGAALRIEPDTLKGKDVKAIFQLASRLRDKVVGSYNDYLCYVSAANQAMKLLGAEPYVEQECDVKPDDATVSRLLDATKDAYRKLTGKAMPEPAVSK